MIDKKVKNQGPIINGIQGELKPIDYSRIEKLRKEAGVTPEYLQQIEKEYEKHWQEKQKENKTKQEDFMKKEYNFLKMKQVKSPVMVKKINQYL